MIQDLLVMLGKSTNCQAVYGNGCTGTYIENGTADAQGMFYGSSDTNTVVKVFGMENLWGRHSWFVEGWIFGDMYNDAVRHRVKITSGTHDGSSMIDYNSNGEGYINLDTSAMSTNIMPTYIKDMKCEKYGRFPIAGRGSTTTYEGDILCIDRSVDAIMESGGTHHSLQTSNHPQAGPFSTMCFNSSSTIYDTVGYRISYKPKLV